MFAQKPVGFGVATTIALTLARDPHHDVRAEAGRALPQLGQKTTSAKGLERHERLSQLLDEPGRVVPYGAIAGLIEATRAGTPISPDLHEHARRLRQHHLSHMVRQAASLFLEATDQSEASPTTH